MCDGEIFGYEKVTQGSQENFSKFSSSQQKALS